MNKYAFILYLVAVFIASISQILLKISANNKYVTSMKQYMNGLVIVSYGLFVLSIVLATLALRKIEYKYGTVMESLSYFFVLIGSSLILKEKLTKRKLLGVGIIVIGIVIFIG